MAVKNIIAAGIGFGPGSTRYLPTRGFLGDGGPSVEEFTLQTDDSETLCTDGGSATLPPFYANGDVTVLSFFLRNTGTVSLTVTFPVSFSGDGSDAEPSAGDEVIGPGDAAIIVIAFDTATAGVGRSVGISVTHDGADSPFTATLGFDVLAVPTANPASIWLALDNN